MLLCSYIYIPVSDMEKSAEWYKEILGFKVTLKDPLYYELSTENGIRIMLLPNEEHINSQMTFPPVKIPHTALLLTILKQCAKNWSAIISRSAKCLIIRVVHFHFLIRTAIKLNFGKSCEILL